MAALDSGLAALLEAEADRPWWCNAHAGPCLRASAVCCQPLARAASAASPGAKVPMVGAGSSGAAVGDPPAGATDGWAPAAPLLGPAAARGPARRPAQLLQPVLFEPPWTCLVSMACLFLAELCLKLFPRLGLHTVLLPLAAAFVTCWLARQFACLQRITMVIQLPVDGSSLIREAAPPGGAEQSSPAALAAPVAGAARPLEMQNPLIAERIQQLSERTRICSRRVWEESYLPELRGGDAGAELMRPAMAQCCVCMSGIEMSDQVRGLACGHIFHLPCLAEWFMRDRTFELCCPLCRVPLSQQGRFHDWDDKGANG